MATTKVSALSALTAPDGAEELLINDGGTSKKITITNVIKLNLKGGDLTSADPLVIDTDGNYFDVTGTTNFTAMTVAANRQFTLQFDGALTMTHHATNLDLPSEANITTAAGRLLIRSLLLVPPSLTNNSSAPSGDVNSVNADTLVVAIFYSVIIYVGVAEIEASVTRK